MPSKYTEEEKRAMHKAFFWDEHSKSYAFEYEALTEQNFDAMAYTTMGTSIRLGIAWHKLLDALAETWLFRRSLKIAEALSRKLERK